MWEIEIRHEGLNKYRHIRGSDRSVVEHKAEAQLASWNELWERKQKARKKQQAREEKLEDKDKKQQHALKLSSDSQNAILEMKKVLAVSVDTGSLIDWSELLTKQKFEVKRPTTRPFRGLAPKEPSLSKVPDKPKRESDQFQPSKSLATKLFSGVRRQREEEAEQRYNSAVIEWEKKKARAERRNNGLLSKHKKAVNALEDRRKAHEKKQVSALKRWEKKRAEFEEQQAEAVSALQALKTAYEMEEPAPGAVLDYFDLVLSQSEYPGSFPKNWRMEFNPDSRTLLVDYTLPAFEAMPDVREVKYIISRDEFKEYKLTKPALNKLYDTVLYQVVLRTLNELFSSDSANQLDAAVFNGWVNSVDRATGQDVTTCVLSVHASKDEFLAFDLSKVDPKETFKKLKGVGSSKLHGLSAIAPIMTITRKDDRFTEAYGVIHQVSEEQNLAAMDWQDFENLIREVFEKEFVSNGGEVKITQASRDGGVDAIAFDPDPIRGGKIVIQAKRYTNTVGVSAVRDLYGTTLNEGATKGILVTTSDYGPDAYRFAKGKPITLLSGGNLLHLLEKHGHKAKIDIREAKRLLSADN